MPPPAASRSRGEKPKVPPSQTPVVSHEIVPGKFNDNDWNLMLEKDGAEDFVDDIVQELTSNILDNCFKLLLERQLIPFTVAQAKDAILTIIQWQFLDRDEGEKSPETDTGWQQDEEPDPAETDCWAQGSVPRSFVPVPTPEPIPEETEVVETEMKEQEEDTQDTAVITEEPEMEDVVSEPDEAAREEAERLAREEEARVKAEEEKKKKKKFKPYTGKVRPMGEKLTESLEQTEMSMLAAEIRASMPKTTTIGPKVTMPASCHSILKVQAGRPPGNKDVEYDDYGNVIAVIKLKPERLPNHRVKVNYQVVDPAIEAAQARLDAMRTGRYVAPKPKRRIQKKDFEKEETSSVQQFETSSFASKTALPPPMIETMDVAPGVIVKEGGRLKQGPSRYIRRIDTMSQNQRGLKPVSTQMTTPRLDVTDLLDRHTPILRPIHDNSPLPPIMAIPHPPEKPKVST